MNTRKHTIAAIGVYGAMMAVLILLKSQFQIGQLWAESNQVNRSVELRPFDQLFYASDWFIPAFGYGGNFLLFVPFGLLLGSRMKVGLATATAAITSLGFEVLQYVFALGYSDIDDLLMNTLGGFVGAVIARLCGPRYQRHWQWLAIALAAIFGVLVLVF
ncbi:VanZ family protein [Corynebacterium sp. 35RC1]|nr:VanZ family protein [Corynebacterium sp. 35RC1]